MNTLTPNFTRRGLLLGAGCTATLALAGCSGRRERRSALRDARQSIARRQEISTASLYPALPGERFPIPAVKKGALPKRFHRQRVRYRTREKPGTVVVDTKRFFLYHVEDDGYAMRYGVGLGRAGFAWSGRANIAWKRPWPTWTPPAEMIAREPHLEKWSAKNGGMPPGLTNPLGARALYIFQDGEDTLYRLHGTPEVFSIGKAVSSGCVRLINQDVIDLYSRVRSGSQIVVI